MDFFKSGHFTGQSDNFSKVDTLPGKVEFWSENGIFEPIFNFFLTRQFDPGSIQISSYGR